MSYRCKSLRVVRVSSAAMRLTSLRILNALIETSSKFPIGVATMYRMPICSQPQVRATTYVNIEG